MTVLQEVSDIKNAVVLIFRYIQCLHMMYSEVAWVLESLGTQAQLQIILSLDHLPDYLSVSYDYVQIKKSCNIMTKILTFSTNWKFILINLKV